MNLYDTINQNVNGATFIGIDTTTKVTLSGGKKNPFQGRVTKKTLGSSVMVFQNKNVNAYDNMVKRRLIEEGKNPDSFELSPRRWGSRIPNTPFVEHKGQLYLEVIFLRPGKVEYYVDGVVTPKDHIPGLPKKTEAEQGGLDDKVVIRTYSLSSIDYITINKTKYQNTNNKLVVVH